MKKFLIGFLIVIILILTSLLYKSSKLSIYSEFPIQEFLNTKNNNIPLFIFAFFSEHNCRDCLKILNELNTLPSHFIINAVVPEKEVKYTIKFQKLTGISFPLLSTSQFKKYIPWHTPTIIVVSPNGYIISVIPVIPGEPGYLKRYLSALYLKLLPVLMEYKMSQSKNP